MRCSLNAEARDPELLSGRRGAVPFSRCVRACASRIVRHGRDDGGEPDTAAEGRSQAVGRARLCATARVRGADREAQRQAVRRCRPMESARQRRLGARRREAEARLLQAHAAGSRSTWQIGLSFGALRADTSGMQDNVDRSLLSHWSDARERHAEEQRLPARDRAGAWIADRGRRRSRLALRGSACCASPADRAAARSPAAATTRTTTTTWRSSRAHAQRNAIAPARRSLPRCFAS